MYPKSRYSEKQYLVVKRSKKDSRRYGAIDDVDPKLNSSEVMNIIAIGRGPNPEFGNVDDQVDITADYNLLGLVSLGRGNNPMYGNIDEMIPLLRTMGLSYNELADIARRRGDAAAYAEYRLAKSLENA